MSDSERQPGFLEVVAARILGRKAAQRRDKPMAINDIRAAKDLAEDPATQADFLEGAAETHWSNPRGPTGGMPPEKPPEPEAPAQPPPSSTPKS